MVRYYFAVIALILILVYDAGSLIDYEIVKIPIKYLVNGAKSDSPQFITKLFVVKYSELNSWERVVQNFLEQNGIIDESNELYQMVENELFEKMKFDQYFDGNDASINSKLTVKFSVNKLVNKLFLQLLMNNNINCSANECYPSDHLFYNDYFVNHLQYDKYYVHQNTTLAAHQIQDDLFHNMYKFVIDSINTRKKSKLIQLIDDINYRLLIDNSANNYTSHNNNSYNFIIYQTIGAFTGGTTAMKILYDHLISLGETAILCNDTNRYDEACHYPKGNLFVYYDNSEVDSFVHIMSCVSKDYQIVVTGEWCHEVLHEYMYMYPSEPDNYSESKLNVDFKGRGIQYYLGFHHSRDYCRGRVAMADSHFIAQLISNQLIGGYYLGCPMTDLIKTSFLNHFQNNAIIYDDYFQNNDNLTVDPKGNALSSFEETFIGANQPTSIRKENLILIDPDLMIDYSPIESLDILIPPGYKYIYARDIPHYQMIVLLQRAKIILDLAMPGPERLSGEGILMGAIPIISNRWNGASKVDFPGIHRVDPQNAQQISNKLAFVAENYENELENIHNVDFLAYMMSLWNRLDNTLEIVAGSSHIHFILFINKPINDEYAQQEKSIEGVLQLEYEAAFQILSLLFIFPLCSIDLYVHDPLWFMRHHYLFINILTESGYMRVDPFNPTEYFMYKKNGRDDSFVSIRPLSTLYEIINKDDWKNNEENIFMNNYNSNDNNNALIPIWNPSFIIVLPIGIIFKNGNELINGLCKALQNKLCDVNNNNNNSKNNHNQYPILINMNSSHNKDNASNNQPILIATKLTIKKYFSYALREVMLDKRYDVSNNNNNNNNHTEEVAKHFSIVNNVFFEDPMITVCQIFSVISTYKTFSSSQQSNFVFLVSKTVVWLKLELYVREMNAMALC
eukprot:gene8992-12130_t